MNGKVKAGFAAGAFVFAAICANGQEVVFKNWDNRI